MKEQPEKIGRYDIERVIGEGAMGVVYCGFDPTIQRRVAIKVVHQHLLGGEQGEALTARFQREAQTAGGCVHPNIVTIFDYGVDDVGPYLAMEYVDGRDLRAILRQTGCIAASQLVEITQQVLLALNYLHLQGIVHRDVKPANIIMLPDGRVKLGDFGIARPQQSDLTGVGLAIGTPCYMSPEQLYGDEVDHRSDYYALGVVMYELVTGRKPYKDDIAAAAITSILTTIPPRPIELNDEVSEGLSALIMKVMSKKPEARFQTGEEFLAALQGLGAVEVQPSAPVSYNDETEIGHVSSLHKPHLPDPRVDEESQPAWKLKAITESLTRFIGPIAPVLVKKTAKKAHDSADLVDQLSQFINNDSERERFLKIKAKLDTAENSSEFAAMKTDETLVIDNELLEALEEDLAFLLGPIAATVMRRSLKKSKNVPELIEHLTGFFDKEDEKAHFLKRMRQRGYLK